MNTLIKVIGLLVLSGMLLACASTSNEANESEDALTESEEEQIKNNDKSESDEGDGIEQEPTELEESAEDTDTSEDEVVLENDSFKIFEPTPDAEVKGQIIVRGLARVFEGAVQYEFENGHFILDEGFTTASAGGPEWGEFTITIDIDELTEGSCKVIIFEESAKDGSRINELIIPVYVKE